MIDPATAIRQAEGALLRCNSTKPTVLRAAVEALLPVARAAVERAEKAEAALAEEREERERAETRFRLVSGPFFALAAELMPLGSEDEARANPASVLPYLEAWFERLKEAEDGWPALRAALRHCARELQFIADDKPCEQLHQTGEGRACVALAEEVLGPMRGWPKEPNASMIAALARPGAGKEGER